VTQEQTAKLKALQATFKSPAAALRARLRGVDRTDMDVNRALMLYIWAMMVLTGQDVGMAGLTMFEHYLRLDKDKPPLGEDIQAVLRGLGSLTIMRALRGPPRRKRRHRLNIARPIIRLNDHHYIAAWVVEQLRHRSVIRNGWRRCFAQEFDEIIDCVVSYARKGFGVHLSAERIRTIVNEPKSRRYTHIFYLD
jgi:hypothetical protein